MKKYFVFSDVHSFYDELMTALKEKDFDIDNPDHIVISCGDLFDRGPQSKECLDFIVNLLKQDRAICIRGNHEDLMEEVFVRGYFKGHDIHNGTDKTFGQLTTLDPDTSFEHDVIDDVSDNEDLRYYLMKCKDYYEVDNNIFVHGWIPFNTIYRPNSSDDPAYKPDWRDAKYNYWFDARWVNGMNLWAQGIYEPDETIYCGHWHASWGHANLHDDGVEHLKRIETMYIDPETGKQEPHVNYTSFKDEGICCLDACTIVSHFVNVEVIES